MNIIAIAKEHPVETGIGVFAVGYIALRLLSGGSSSASSSDDNLQGAYFAAESAQAQAGDALQATQIEAQASTAQTLIGANASVINNQTWAQAQMQGNDDNVQIAGINSKTAIAVAPYATESNLISALGGAAQQPGSVVTSSASDDFLGLFGSSSSTQSYQANPAAVNATSILGELAGTGYHAGNG